MSQRAQQRMQVQIVQIRAQDVLPGDIVNKTGPVRDGWVEIAYTEPLPDGRVNLCDESYRKSFVSEPLDLIWLQIAMELRGNSHLPTDGRMHVSPENAPVPGDRESVTAHGDPMRVHVVPMRVPTPPSLPAARPTGTPSAAD